MRCTIPPLRNGFERVSYDTEPIGGARLHAFVTEDEPIGLMSVDSGLELVVEPGPKSHDGFTITVVIKAVRRRPAPSISFGDS